MPGPLGIIDIGTNTVLLLIVDPALRPIVDACRFGRLGEGLEATGALAPAAIARCLDICREYRALLDAHGVAHPRVVGTAALRDAANAAAFVEPAAALLGAPIEIIDGTREAALVAGAVAHTFPALARAPHVVVDVGGGSTEIVVADEAGVASAVSLPIGAVRLTERHLRHDPPTTSEVRALISDIDAHLAPLVAPHGTPVVGTAGTATTLAAMSLGLPTHDPVRVTGVRLAPMAIDQLLARLLTAPLAQRRGLRGLAPERADVIAGGVAILARVLHRLEAPGLITCDRGVRWGLAYECSAGPR